MDTIVTKWWWVRHAPVTSNQGRIYGDRDLPCDTSDVEAFKGLAALLPPEAVRVTSNLMRTHQTADAIAEQGYAYGESLIEPDLREQSFGDWQGMTYTDFDDVRDGLVHRYWISPAHERAPAGESFVDLIARVTPVITRLSADYAGRNIIAVTHGGTIRAALSFALGLDPESALAFAIENHSVTRLDHICSPEGNSWRICFANLRPALNLKVKSR